jgi:hypothetical protein
VITFAYDGNERRDLTARCRRADGSEHVVAAAEVAFPANTNLSRYLAAYRKWMGLDPYPAGGAARSRGNRRHKAKTGDPDLTSPIELIVFSVKKKAARCRLPESERVFTLRAPRFSKLLPGEIAKIAPHKQWSYAGHSYLSGEILSTRFDVATLGLVPLRLEQRGTWDPKEEYWGEEGRFSTIEPRRSSLGDPVSPSKWSRCFRWTTPTIRMAIPLSAPTTWSARVTTRPHAKS